MGNVYEEIGENLGKLKRNEEQMTPEQKEQYKKPLKALQKKIASQASEILQSFLLMGVRVMKDEMTKEMEERLSGIIKEEQPVIDRASKILFSTYDVQKFLDAALSVEERIFHEWYGPYWVAHCKVQPDGTIYNDIIKMAWDDNLKMWVNPEEKSFTIMLPPTMDAIME